MTRHQKRTGDVFEVQIGTKGPRKLLEHFLIKGVSSDYGNTHAQIDVMTETIFLEKRNELNKTILVLKELLLEKCVRVVGAYETVVI